MTHEEKLDKLEIIIKYCFLKVWLEQVYVVSDEEEI